MSWRTSLKSTLIPLMALMAFNTSCSWYKNLERSLVEDDQNKARKSKTVSREQYDNLLVKYEELSKKYEETKTGKPVTSELVDELQNTETVDVFANEQIVISEDVPTDVESQVLLFKRAIALKSSKPGEATRIFQQLESQGIPAVKVRAKYQIGEMLYERGQFDVALQVFEDIIQKQAHSGMVLSALKLAEACSEKLNLKQKKDQYGSMIRDVFEAN